MTKKDCFEAFYKERDLSDFINLIIGQYEQSPDALRSNDPASVLLAEDVTAIKHIIIRSRLMDFYNTAYTPKLLQYDEGEIIHHSLCLLQSVNSPYAKNIEGITKTVTGSELLFYILGVLVRSEIPDADMMLFMDMVYTICMFLHDVYGVAIGDFKSQTTCSQLNVVGREFCTGVDVVTVLRRTVNAMFNYGNSMSCLTELRTQEVFCDGIIEDKFLEDFYGDMIFNALFGKVSNFTSSDWTARLVYTAGLELIRFNSDLHVDENITTKKFDAKPDNFLQLLFYGGNRDTDVAIALAALTGYKGHYVTAPYVLGTSFPEFVQSLSFGNMSFLKEHYANIIYSYAKVCEFHEVRALAFIAGIILRNTLDKNNHVIVDVITGYFLNQIAQRLLNNDVQISIVSKDCMPGTDVSNMDAYELGQWFFGIK